MLMMFFWVELILSSSNYPRIIVSPRRRVAASLLVYASCLRCDFPAKKSVFGAKKVLTSSALCPTILHFSTSVDAQNKTSFQTWEEKETANFVHEILSLWRQDGCLAIT